MGKEKSKATSWIIAKRYQTFDASKTYSFGTKIVVEEYGTFVIEDKGSAIQDKKLDIFFNAHQEALIWVVKNSTRYVA